MCKITIEKEIEQNNLSSFLHKVDNYFTKSLHSTCNQPTLEKWAGYLLERANFVVAKNDLNEIVGLLVFYENREREYIYVTIAVVLKNYQGRHIALNMFKLLEEYSKRYNRLGIHLHTFKENVQALTFYLKMGFIIKDEDKNSLVSLYKS